MLDQDLLPLPAWDLFPPMKSFWLQTVRGCPFNCVFCMNHNGRIARSRSVQNVVAEIRWLLDEHGIGDLRFGAELCTACEAGQFEVGGTACTACEAGRWSADGAVQGGGARGWDCDAHPTTWCWCT